MRKLKPRNQLGRGSDQGHAVKQLAGKGEERPKNTLQSRHVPPPQPSSCQAEARKGVGPGRELAQVTPSPSNRRPPGHTQHPAQMANRAGPRRRDGTAEGAGASRLPQAPEHRGRSAANCAPSSQVPPRNRGLYGPGACTLSGLREHPRRPTCPLLGAQCAYPRFRNGAPICALAFRCARVSLPDLLLLPEPVRLRATSTISPDSPLFPGRRANPGSRVSCQWSLPFYLP